MSIMTTTTTTIKQTNTDDLSSQKVDWKNLVMLIYEHGPDQLRRHNDISRRIVQRAYNHLVDTDYQFLDELDEVMVDLGFTSRRRFYKVQKDFSGRLVIVLPVDFLAKTKGDKVRVEFIHHHDDAQKSITLS